MGNGIEKIHEKIRSFQNKYYLNIFIRGGILTLSLILAYFLLAAIIEHSLWLEPAFRSAIFFAFFVLVGYCFYKFLKEPFQWWITRQGMGEEKSASMIGERLPGVKDRLLNLLQLSRNQDSSLAMASVLQRTSEFEPLPFDSVVDFKENRRLIKFLAIPVGLLLLIAVINQQVITESAKRIIHFNQEFSPSAPFQFIVQNRDLTAFYNENFVLKVNLEGHAIPENVYMQAGNVRLKLVNEGDGSFSYTFENVQSDFSFLLEAAGFYSPKYTVALVSRPELTGFTVGLDFPKYIQRKPEVLNNAGNLEIPEGTIVNWKLSTSNAQKAQISFSSESAMIDMQPSNNQMFEFGKSFVQQDRYEIILENPNSRNRDKISYRIDVIKDQHPSISVTNFTDTVLFKRVMLGGVVGDDYGITQLDLHYKIVDENRREILTAKKNISLLRGQQQQSFTYNWALDTLQLKPGHQLEYYLAVWDNDGVNGRKSTRSASYTFFIPSKDKLVTDINQSSKQTQNKIDESATKANQLQDQIEQANQRLRGKQNLDWQDKKMLEDIVRQKQNLDQLIDQMKKQNEALQDKKDAFTEQDERIREKAEQLQKLMDELLDEETRKLFEELQKLLKENADVSQLQKLLDKLNQNTRNLEKELDRMLELFKQIEFESKFDQALKRLSDQIEQQKELLEKTKSIDNQQDKSKENNKGKESDPASEESKSGNEELAQEQESLKEDTQKMAESLEELKELSKELNQSDEVPSSEDAQDVMKEQEDSQKMLEQNQPSKSKESQQKAIDKMQQMQQQMQSSQNSMMMEIDMQNLESLRQILHGLIKLSFDQEGLMKRFSDLQTNDPRFNSLAEEQLRLRDNAKVLQDSLLALSKKDPFMGSFVTKEIGELNNHLEKVLDAHKERRKPQAQSAMQLSMTSINNLALMLDSHFDMMMQMMANAKPSKKGSKSKKQGNQNLSQLQQQLNNKIQELKNSGKSGRELSEELAEMAAEQERIRRAIQEMQEKMKKDGVTPGGDLPSKMEQTEMDLVNKQLTDQLIKRQQEILTRLLEAEKSMREQDMDDERKGETAKDYEKEFPKAFEEYLRLKEKEVELLKTVPPKLYPYYKREVDEYFKRMGNQ